MNFFYQNESSETNIISHASHLNAATATKHALAAYIVAPPTSWLQVIQRHVANFVLSARAADHGTHPAARFSAWCTAQIDLECYLIVRILPPAVEKPE